MGTQHRQFPSSKNHRQRPVSLTAGRALSPLSTANQPPELNLPRHTRLPPLAAAAVVSARLRIRRRRQLQLEHQPTLGRSDADHAGAVAAMPPATVAGDYARCRAPTLGETGAFESTGGATNQPRPISTADEVRDPAGNNPCSERPPRTDPRDRPLE